MKRILISPNSFKECENSVNAAALIEKYLQKELAAANGKFEFIQKPISDGGDGFLEVCKKLFDAKSIHYEISNVFNSEKFFCEIAYSEKLKTVFIESAKVLGLQLIPEEKRNVLKSNSGGLGELLFQIQSDAISKKYKIEKVIIGIGGTATSDLGIGAASTFGLKLFDKNEIPLEPLPINFEKIKSIEWNLPEFPFEIEIVIDVKNPVTGKTGAAKTFAKQKGASGNEVEILENGAINFLKIFQQKFKVNEIEKLSGAGGGLGFGFQIFFNAKTIFAKDFIKEKIGISKDQNYDLIITGEGKFDEQTFNEKGVHYLLDEFRREFPMIIVAGKINFKKGIIDNHFENVYFIELSKYFENENDSIKYFEKAIEFASKEIIKIIKERNLTGAK